MVMTLDDIRNDFQRKFLMCKLSKCHFKIEFRQTVMELGWKGGQPLICTHRLRSKLTKPWT